MTGAGSEPVVRVSGVTFRYAPGARPALEDVSLTILKEDFLGVIGPNGGGKTTLLKILLGMLVPERGEVRVLGRPPREVSRRIGYVPQYVHLDPHAPATVLDIVLTGRLGLSPFGFRYSREHVRAAREALEMMGVADLAGRRSRELSGGQRQRVLVARALASRAEILLLDEPMAGVDMHMEQGILNALRELNRRMPIVLVSHDVGFVSAHVTRVACLNHRLVVHPVEELSPQVIREMYREAGPVHALGHRHGCPAAPPDPCEGEP